MRPSIFVVYIFLMTATVPAFFATGQEHVGPLRWNPAHASTAGGLKKAAKKTTASLPLPFFEDFTDYTPYPDSNKWADFEVYINNTMGVSPVSRGVATFDDLNAHGLPYDSFSNTAVRYADSLTSQPIDISADSVGDSIYLSFFYQAQGNGFFPNPEDSLMLFLKNKYGDFIKVWSVPGPNPGSVVQPFQQVMIPITDSLDFHAAFQFRFVNIASLNWADAIWNVDYIRLDKNRNVSDTTISDVAFTSNPTFLLSDYTSMPYSQFKVNPSSEISSQVTDSIRVDTSLSQTVNYSFTIKDGAFILGGSAGSTSLFVDGYQTAAVTNPFSGIFPGHPANTSVIFETTYYLQSNANTGPSVNDTIVTQQVFDNYLAYDDGTAEKSYYLNLFPSLPGKIAIEYHLNKPDTLRGMSIYFGRQIPFANYKPFEINIYSALAGVNGDPFDVVLYSSPSLSPAYADSVNHFWTYIFDTPLLLPAGTFYAGTTQSAEDGSDSLYYGLDVNRIGGNHAYYNVLGEWSPSLIGGAIMMRPVIGKAVSGSNVNSVQPFTGTWWIMPNPASDVLKFEFGSDQPAGYAITDIQGHALSHGTIGAGKAIDISTFAPGMYFVTLVVDGIASAPQKIIKL